MKVMAKLWAKAINYRCLAFWLIICNSEGVEIKGPREGNHVNCSIWRRAALESHPDLQQASWEQEINWVFVFFFLGDLLLWQNLAYPDWYTLGTESVWVSNRKGTRKAGRMSSEAAREGHTQISWDYKFSKSIEALYTFLMFPLRPQIHLFNC